MTFFLRVSLSEYAPETVSELHVVETVQLTNGKDPAPYEALLSEFQDGVDKIWKDSLLTSLQQSNYTFSFTENALMDMEIFALPEHQSPLEID
ncbi:4680_t:CDS:2, partial [Rhizophagus irregularis]